MVFGQLVMPVQCCAGAAVAGAPAQHCTGMTNWPNTIQCLGEDDLMSLGIKSFATKGIHDAFLDSRWVCCEYFAVNILVAKKRNRKEEQGGHHPVELRLWSPGVPMGGHSCHHQGPHCRARKSNPMLCLSSATDAIIQLSVLWPLESSKGCLLAHQDK